MSSKSKITMQTIADDVGVSKMTVSRYFNGGYISELNKKKIEEYVKKYNYTPNFLARNLKNQSNIIGIVAPKIDNQIFNELVKGFISEASKYDVQLLFFPTNYDSEKEDNAIESLIAMNAKGIIVDSNSITIQKKKYYDVDNLISFGLKSDFKYHVYFPEILAFKSILPKDPNINIKFVYRNAMLSTRTSIATKAFSQKNESKLLVEEMEICENLETNTLYVCSTDEIAYNVYRAARKLNIQIGEDIYVVGIGGSKDNDLLIPSLTSIYFPFEELGSKMIEMIITNNLHSFCSSFNIIEGDSYKTNLYL